MYNGLHHIYVTRIINVGNKEIAREKTLRRKSQEGGTKKIGKQGNRM